MLPSRYRIFLYGGIALLLGLTVLVIVAFVKAASSPSANVPTNVGEITAQDHVKGNPDAKVTLIEYSDFQCPACSQYAGLMEEMMGEFSQHVAFAYRHFPLEGHRNAKPAVRSAEAAAKQGKFWEMHNGLFANQALWVNESDPQAIFVQMAEALEMDIEKFLEDYNSKELKEFADQTYEEASGLGLSYTPTIILNGEIIPNPRSKDDFRNILRQAVEEAGNAENSVN